MKKIKIIFFTLLFGYVVISAQDNWGAKKIVINTDIPENHAIVETVYKVDLNEDSLKMRLYYPDKKLKKQYPVVLFVFGFSDAVIIKSIQKRIWNAAQYTSWAILLASEGYCAITYEVNSPVEDLKDLFQYIQPRITIVSDGRFCDTSATDRYYSISSGWKVHKRSGGSEKRNCITTRKDGCIVIKKYIGQDTRPYLSVIID